MSQENSRFASTLNVNGTTYAYYPVSAVAGSEQLPYSLTVPEYTVRNCPPPPESWISKVAGRLLSRVKAMVTLSTWVPFFKAKVI